MMISPETYISEKKNWSLKKLSKEKNILIEDIRRFEEGNISPDEYFMNPSPEVIYGMNKQYLSKLEMLIESKSKMENNEEVYYYLTVKYEDYEGYKNYNYISEDDTVEIGDRVLVDRAGYLAVAEVLDTGYYNELNSPFPVEKTKRIIKKVDENFDLEDIEDYNEDEYYFDEEDRFSLNGIKMNIDGTYFELGVGDYIPGEDNDNNWANIKIRVYNSCFKYFRNSELMTCAEIEYLLEELDALLNDKIDKQKKIAFYEPDLDFCLYPKINLWDTGEYAYIKEGHEIQDIYIELNINLADRKGVYTGQKYVMIFERDEIQKIVDYIKRVVENSN